jgi:hypothetical protein
MPKYIIEIETDIPFTRSSVKDAVRALLPHPITKPSPEGWISVKDRLPESGKRVLLACENRGILKYQVTGSYHADNKGWYVLDWSGMGENIMMTRDAVVTHWMPQPDAPK